MKQMTHCEISKHWLYEMADEVVRSFDSCQTILKKDLGMRLILPKSIPQQLAVQCVSSDMVICAAKKQDEIWICSYNTQTKQESSQWKYPTLPQTRKTKIMWNFSFDFRGIVHRCTLRTVRLLTNVYIKSVLPQWYNAPYVVTKIGIW